MTSIGCCIYRFIDEVIIGRAENQVELRRHWAKVDTHSIRQPKISHLRDEHLEKGTVRATMNCGVTFWAKRYQVAVERFKTWGDATRDAMVCIQRAIASAAALALELVSLQNLKPGFLPVHG